MRYGRAVELRSLTPPSLQPEILINKASIVAQKQHQAPPSGASDETRAWSARIRTCTTENCRCCAVVSSWCETSTPCTSKFDTRHQIGASILPGIRRARSPSRYLCRRPPVRSASEPPASEVAPPAPREVAVVRHRMQRLPFASHLLRNMA